MTDKVVINGVDVSRCEHWNICKQCQLSQLPESDYKLLCKDNPNCSFKQLSSKTYELEVICKAFDIEYAYDDDGKICGRSNKLRSLEQECEELKAEKEVIKKYLGISDKSIMQRLEELTEYKLKRQLKYIKIEEERDRYLKALEEIQDFRKKHCDFWCEGNRILDIINKAKGDNK